MHAKCIREELDIKAFETYKTELKTKCQKSKKLNYDVELEKLTKKFNRQKEKAALKAEKQLAEEKEYTRKMEILAIKKDVNI